MLTIKEKVAPAWFPLEKDENGAAVLIAPLPSYDAIDFRNEISTSRGKVMITGQGIRIGGLAVRDWRNVQNAKGETIPFSRAEYDNLDIEYLQRIAIEVWRRTFLSEIERKNSSSPSTSG